ncbi:MAG: hypothetical protein IJA26_02945, partial [Clostridia bacterium]|nr:hypothetical protein [Clostridia bacterium]
IWLSESVWLFTPEMQKKTALAAAEKANWQFLKDYSCQLKLEECALRIASMALAAGEVELVSQLAGQQLEARECAELANKAWDARNAAMLEVLSGLCEKEFMEDMMKQMAGEGEWTCVERCLRAAGSECIETLMDIAVDQGDFDAVDMLDEHL